MRSINIAGFGIWKGQEVFRYSLTNARGNTVCVTNYGATLISWDFPDREGHKANVLLGFNSLQEYLLASESHVGGIIGRYANRIRGGQFAIHGRTFRVSNNEGKNHLHGGYKGFDQVLWRAAIPDRNEATLVLEYESKDGEEGYPGNLSVKVTYSYSDDDTLSIAYWAVTDQPTPINLTNHAYLNLSGDFEKPVLEHVLRITADAYLPTDEDQVPDGNIASVNGTRFDFRELRRIHSGDAGAWQGYDHCYVLRQEGEGLSEAATLYEPASGRRLLIHTSEPGVQLYTGNHLDASLRAANGQCVVKHGALCLETQHFPDAPNRPHFPNTILEPGEVFSSTTTLQLLIE